jgi:3-hydroxypropanoate dehydrogenase
LICHELETSKNVQSPGEYFIVNKPLSQYALDKLFLNARTHAAWQEKPVSDGQLRELYDLAKWGPTSMNCLPMRLVFVKSDMARERLKPALAEGNIEKMLSAPVTAIIAYDTKFYEHLPQLFPHIENARDMYADDGALSAETALRNGSLQGAYLMLAARSLGLDVGAMSGFDSRQVDSEFFPDGRYRSNFLVNIGYGEHDQLHTRGPRLEFEMACRIS